MRRIYFLRLWFNLSDPAVEEALYDSVAIRSFVGIDLAVEGMFELGAGRVSGTAADGNLLLAQLRMGVYCYLSVLATVGASSHP